VTIHVCLQKYPIVDLLRTSVEHICTEISRSVKQVLEKPTTVIQKSVNLQLLVTGGGAHNKFLMRSLKETFALHLSRNNVSFVDCDSKIIDFKEAIIFAFMAVRCVLGLNNIDSNKTGGGGREIVAGSIQYGGADRAHTSVPAQPLSVSDFKVLV